MHREHNAAKIHRSSSSSQAKQTHGLGDRQRRRFLGVPWPLSKAVMGPTWAFCSPEAVGVIICQGARVRVCVRVTVFLRSCLRGGARGFSTGCRRASRPASWCCGPKQDEMHIHSTLYSSSRLCDLYVPHRHTHTHTLYVHLFLTPQSWGSGVSEEERGWGKRLRSHLWHGAWGPTAQSPIPCSSMWKMAGEQEEEEGKEAKKSGGKRRRERQLVGSADHQGNTHLIDMWNLNSSNKSIGSTTMDQSSKVCWWKPRRGSDSWGRALCYK